MERYEAKSGTLVSTFVTLVVHSGENFLLDMLQFFPGKIIYPRNYKIFPLAFM